MSTSTRDIGLHESGSGGEFTILNDDLLLSETLFNTIYIALFGGNVEADTLGNEIVGEERFDYWGNSLVFADLPDKQFNSQTERTLRNTTVNTEGRLIIQKAVENDLSFLSKIVNFTVSIILLDTNKIKIEIRLESISNTASKEIQFIWDNARNEVIINKTI